MAFGQLKGNFELCFIVPKARQAMTSGHCPMQLGGAVSPPWIQGRVKVGVQETKLEDLENLHFMVPR